jgi:molybdopterin-binding protein
MIVTPAAVENFFNVNSSIFIDVPKGCCVTVSVTNTSGIEIAV